jgi:hypothetical protein
MQEAEEFIVRLLEMSPIEVTRFTEWIAQELAQTKAKAAGAK